ncbi:MAG: type II toxin-antitoxin system RelE/ParE family toxin [Isosphaeraceae bacterium]|jgi:mRNA interferase RelE/StbE
MDDYAIEFTRSARKELVALPPKLAQRVLTNIEGLQRDPRPPGSRKLEGSVYLWRIRIGHYRALYAIDDARRIVEVIAVRHRRDAYR